MPVGSLSVCLIYRQSFALFTNCSVVVCCAFCHPLLGTAILKGLFSVFIWSLFFIVIVFFCLYLLFSSQTSVCINHPFTLLLLLTTLQLLLRLLLRLREIHVCIFLCWNFSDFRFSYHTILHYAIFSLIFKVWCSTFGIIYEFYSTSQEWYSIHLSLILKPILWGFRFS